MSKDLVIVVEQDLVDKITSAYAPIIQEMQDIENDFLKIIDQKEITEDLSKKAKELRLKYVKIRKSSDAVHKKEKSVFLGCGKYIDDWKNTQLEISITREEELTKIEKHFENIEKERKERT